MRLALGLSIVGARIWSGLYGYRASWNLHRSLAIQNKKVRLIQLP